jgi:hypothetical protein
MFIVELLNKLVAICLVVPLLCLILRPCLLNLTKSETRG